MRNSLFLSLFFFSSRRRHTRLQGDWSSDVCSSDLRESQGGNAIGVIGSNRTTNEENYLLQKFARSVLGTNNIDHHRTADYPAFAKRSEERRVGKECRSRWSPYH